MSKYEFEIWKVKNPEFRIICNLIADLIIIIWIILVLFFSPVNNVIIAIFVTLMVVFIPSLIGYLKIRKVIYTYVGNIFFNDYTILFPDKKEYSYTEIKEIKLKYTGLEGVTLTRLKAIAWAKSQGKDNTITMRLENKTLKFNIYLRDINDYIQFKRLYHFLKEKGIKVKTIGFTENMDNQPNGKPLIK